MQHEPLKSYDPMYFLGRGLAAGSSRVRTGVGQVRSLLERAGTSVRRQGRKQKVLVLLASAHFIVRQHLFVL